MSDMRMDTVAVYGSRCHNGDVSGLGRFLRVLEERMSHVFIHGKLAGSLAGLGVPVPDGVEVVDDFPPEARVAISIGGDGTFLRTVQWIGSAGTPVVGVNTGHLGFLSTFSLDETDRLVEMLLDGSGSVETRMMLRVSGCDVPTWPFAVNDVAVVKSMSTNMVTARTFVDGKFLADYMGDGIVVATATGSTAYNLSVGGPILEPSMRSMVLSPVAPHSLTMRPLVLGGSSKVEMQIFCRAEECSVALDGRFFTLRCRDPREKDTVAFEPDLVISAAPFALTVLRRPDSDFASIIRDKLLWGRR